MQFIPIFLLLTLLNVKASGQTIDSLSYEIIKEHADTSQRNPYDTVVNGVSLDTFITSFFPKEFRSKNVRASNLKYLLNGKYNIITKGGRELIRVYNESGMYIKVSYVPDSIFSKAHLHIPFSATKTVRGVHLGMKIEEFLKLMPGSGFKQKQEPDITILYFAWRPPYHYCFDSEIPFILYCLPYYSEFHFSNGRLIEFGLGYTRHIPYW